MMFFGIDPGLKGGIAILDEGAGYSHPMPTIPTGKGSRRTYDLDEIRLRFGGGMQNDYALGQSYFAMIERQQAMPSQGVSSMFMVGYGYGVLCAMLSALRIPYEIVHPKTWQKEFAITSARGDTKAQSVMVSKKMFPDVCLLPTERSRKASDGMSDALLIAEFARRKYKGQT